MGDFKTFVRHLKKGDMDAVTRSFRPEFLDRPDTWKMRPIDHACYNGYVNIAKFLIEHSCDMECKDDKGWRPIHHACSRGHVDIAKFLIEHNCDLECKDNKGWTPIHHACYNGHANIAKLLVSNRCDLQCRSTDGDTPLELANRRKHQACGDFLTKVVKLEQFFDCVRKDECQILEGMNCGDVVTRVEIGTGLSFLEVVLEVNAEEVLKYFLDKRIEDSEIPLINNFIENCSRPVAVELMQEFFLYRSIRYHHADGFELSCLANIVNGLRNIVSTSFVEIAAEYGSSAFISEILKKSIYNEEEWTKAKDLATLKGHNKIVDGIMDRKILLTSRAKAHFSAFHNAICDNDPDLMKYIFENNLANPNFNNEVVGTGLSLAHMLCYGKCIQTLQQFNVDVNTQNKYSQSPLHEAISSGMTDHCSYLISQAKDIDKPGFMGLSSLQYAVIEGCENLCGDLVKNGADCIRYVEGFQQSHFKKTVLPLSTLENAVTLCMKMHETIYPCFLEVLDSDKVNCSDGNENTLLHLAVKSLLPHLCETLINCGADVEAMNMQGNSPIFELFTHVSHKIMDDNIDRVITISNILIDSGADINKKSRSGMTIFENASQCNSERLMVYILSKKPDLKLIPESDFKLAFINGWFFYAKALLRRIPKDCIKSMISTEIFHLAITRVNAKILKAMFMKASSDVQQSIIEDLLQHFTDIDEYEAFIKLIETKVIQPKLFSNGESLFTNLLKVKNEKYCRAVIRHSANKKYLNMANASKQNPLQVGIEAELYDLIYPLIFECDQLNNEDIYGNTPLKQLFQKISISTDINTDETLMTAIKYIQRNVHRNKNNRILFTIIFKN